MAKLRRACTSCPDHGDLAGSLWSCRLLPSFSPNYLPSTRQLVHGAPDPGDVMVILGVFLTHSGASSVNLSPRLLLMVL